MEDVAAFLESGGERRRVRRRPEEVPDRAAIRRLDFRPLLLDSAIGLQPCPVVAAISLLEGKHPAPDAARQQADGKGPQGIAAQHEQARGKSSRVEGGREQVEEDVLGRSHDIAGGARAQRQRADFADGAGPAGGGKLGLFGTVKVLQGLAVVVEPARRTGRIQRFEAEADADDRAGTAEGPSGSLRGDRGPVARKVERAGEVPPFSGPFAVRVMA